MEKEITFSYSYSAKRDKEIQEIRRKYMPQGESKFDELKRLDNTVQMSGMIESLCAGIGSTLIFGIGLCLALEIIGSGMFLIILGVLLGSIGAVGMIAAYPIYRSVFRRVKNRLTPRILELTEELSGEKTAI